MGQVRFGTSVNGVKDRNGDVVAVRVFGAATVAGLDQGSVSAAAARALPQAFARAARYGALDYSDLTGCDAALRAAVQQELAHACGVPPDVVTLEMLSVQLPADFQPRAPSGASAVSPGTAVRVGWSDGNVYEGTVLEVKDDQVLVGFPDGQQHWCPPSSLLDRS
jgi:hypothetical protein